MRFDQRVPAAAMIGKAGGAPVSNNVSHWVPGATFNNFSKDKNAEFLSWYRFVTARGYSSCPCLLLGDCLKRHSDRWSRQEGHEDTCSAFRLDSILRVQCWHLQRDAERASGQPQACGRIDPAHQRH
jgi:hypothetical protein